MKVLNTSLLGAIPVVAASITVLTAHPSQAAILSAIGVPDPIPNKRWVHGSDQVNIYPDSYFQTSTLNLSGRSESFASNSLGGFNEQQSVKLDTDISVNIDIYQENGSKAPSF